MAPSRAPNKQPWDLLGLEKHQLPLLLPTAYRDYRCVVTAFDQLASHVGQQVVVTGFCVHQGWASGPKPRYVLRVTDAAGQTLSLSLFCTAADTELLPQNEEAAFCGLVVTDYTGRCHLNKVEAVPLALMGRVVPVYPPVRGKLDRFAVFSLMCSALDECLPEAVSSLRAATTGIPVGDLRRAIGCRSWTFSQMLAAVHWPVSLAQGEACLTMLERLAAYVEAYRLKHADRGPTPVCRPLPSAGFAGLPERCPFPLTGEQIAISEAILGACNQPSPSHNLLLGEVGYGKSYCIALVVGAAARAGARVAVMLPSRILVNQMHSLFISLFPELSPQLLTDESTSADNVDSLIWCGTTGLLHRSWSEPWDLVVVDEQQRFSVQQRQGLGAAHVLEATATPICRTMALARWGGKIQIFRLTQSPVKRRIDTLVFTHADRPTLMNRLMQTRAGGGQVLVVCARKEETKADTKMSVKDRQEMEAREQASVEQVVRDFERIGDRMERSLGFRPRIVFATGGRTAEENEGALQAMKDQEAHILIATTVVETGVNLPFLRHVLIVNADRLGAVQLHQLRGRLVRTGGHGLFDLYLPNPPSPTTLKRMEILTTHTQGYEVALADLRLRGCGDLLKGSSQAGAGTSLLPRRPINIDFIEQFIVDLDNT